MVPNNTIVVGADSRFATTFLSTKYRDKAVSGEVLMDKSSGEIFIKRSSDGKIVSFYQNKKMLNDLASDFRTLVNDTPGFVYPKDDEATFYISTNYDLISINNENLYNLITDNVVIPGGPEDTNKLTFKVTGKSNGFFCRNTTRDVDRPLVEYICNYYNKIFKNYAGENSAYLAEHNKFDADGKWERSAATITYDITVSKGGSTSQYNDITDYIAMNDDCAVLFPQQIYDDLGTIDSATVTIKSITYDKIRFIMNIKNELSPEFISNCDRLISRDNKIDVAEFIISYFVKDASDIIVLGNEIMVAMLDMPHINRYMAKMNKLIKSMVEVSDLKPNIECLWFKPKK